MSFFAGLEKMTAKDTGLYDQCNFIYIAEDSKAIDLITSA